MNDARDELFEALTGGGWHLAPGEADAANTLIDNFAEELAKADGSVQRQHAAELAAQLRATTVTDTPRVREHMSYDYAAGWSFGRATSARQVEAG